MYDNKCTREHAKRQISSALPMRKVDLDKLGGKAEENKKIKIKVHRGRQDLLNHFCFAKEFTVEVVKEDNNSDLKVKRPQQCTTMLFCISQIIFFALLVKNLQTMADNIETNKGYHLSEGDDFTDS